MKIRDKILTAVVVLFVFLGAFVMYGLNQFIDLQHKQLDEMVTTTAELSTVTAIDALRKGNMMQFSRLLQEIAATKAITEFDLLSPQGKVLFSANPAHVGTDRKVLIEKSKDGIVEFENAIGRIVEVRTSNYCMGCHPTWKEGSVNSCFFIACDKTPLSKMSSMATTGRIMLVAALVISLVVIMAILYFSVGMPIANFMKGVKEVSQGNFAYRFDEKGKDEMAQLAHFLNRFVTDISSQMLVLYERVETVNKQSKEVMGLATRIASASSVQLGIAQQVKDETIKMADVKEQSSTLSAQASITLQNIQTGQGHVSEMATGVTDMSNAIDEISLSIARLDSMSKEIQSMSSVIADIANQTNLLALNATIESARAGEAGKGFAVVANEIKELSKRTQEATEQIEKILATIHSEMLSNASMAQKGGEKAARAQGLMKNLGEFFYDMLNSAQAIGNGVRQISDVTQEAVSGLSENANKAYSLSTEIESDVMGLKNATEALGAVINQLEANIVELKKRLAS